jgi:hypothetical protein
MVAYSFKHYFAPQIEARIKRQTIRADRRRHARPGEPVQLFVAMRTKHCRKIIPDPRCESVVPVEIEIVDGLIVRITVDGRDLGDAEMEQFARNDGFAPEHFNEPSGYCAQTALENMETFWLDHHGQGIFLGVLIRWSER